MIFKLIKSKKGEGYIDLAVIILSIMMIIALAVNVLPVFITQYRINSYAHELIRTAETSGEVGNDVNMRTQELNSDSKLNPTITWDADYIDDTSEVQLNDSISLTVSKTVDIGFFTFGSFKIDLSSKVTGRSEVYWK
jgi:hypothetical protein